MIRKKIESFISNTGIFRHYLKKYKKFYLLGGVFLLLVDILVLIHPLVLKKAIDAIEKNNRMDYLLILAVLYFVLAIFIAIGRFYWRINLSNGALRSMTDIRFKFFRHLTGLTGNFFTKTSSGDLMSLATNDISSIRQMLGPGILIFTDAILYLITVPILLIYLSPRLALYSFIFLPFIPFIITKMANLTHRTWRDVQDEFASVTTTVHENVSGIRIVKSYNNTEEEIVKLEGKSKRYLKKLIRFAFVHSLFHPLISFVFEIGVILFLVLGGLYIVKGEVSLGTYVAFYFYIDYLTWPMIAIGWVTSMYNRAVASKKRLENVTDLEPEIKDNSFSRKASNKIKTESKIKLEFKNLSFNYAGSNKPAVKNINLKVYKGSTVGIVGAVGSGKSTLVNLVPRLFEVPKNSIFIDGIDIRCFPLTSLRDKVAFVPQEVFLFSHTIKSNISFSDDSILEEKVMSLAKQVNIYDEISSLSNGFNTMLGEKGVNLSGGQKQRISIARALAANREIIIFDDSFSSIDTEVEEQILSNIKTHIQEKTTIIIAHRVSTLKYADRIVVLKDGEIIEDGTHEELIKNNGYYSSLVRYQSEISL